MMERFLERITYSKYKDDFIVKGGILVTSMIGISMRSTMDIDTTIRNFDLTKEVIIGIISSFAMGIIAIKFLLNYIKKHDFSVFAFYMVILALVVFVKLIFFK